MVEIHVAYETCSLQFSDVHVLYTDSCNDCCCLMALGSLLLLCLLATAAFQCFEFAQLPAGDECARIGTMGFRLVLRCSANCSSNTSSTAVEWQLRKQMRWNATYRRGMGQCPGPIAVTGDAPKLCVSANGSLIISGEEMSSSTLGNTDVACFVLLDNSSEPCGKENFTLHVLSEFVYKCTSFCPDSLSLSLSFLSPPIPRVPLTPALPSLPAFTGGATVITSSTNSFTSELDIDVVVGDSFFLCLHGITNGVKPGLVGTGWKHENSSIENITDISSDFGDNEKQCGAVEAFVRPFTERKAVYLLLYRTHPCLPVPDRFLSVLRINKVELADGGEYVFTVTNRFNYSPVGGGRVSLRTSEWDTHTHT